MAPPQAVPDSHTTRQSQAGERRSLRSDVREMLVELIEYRELLFSMARRDFLLRYKQTVMGVGWSILMPVTNMLAFSVIFTRVVRLETGLPYPIYAFTGLLAWNFFASSLRFSVNALVGNSSLITKVYFPREVLPFSMILVSLVDFAVGAVVLAGLMIYYQVPVHTTIVMLPLVLLIQLAFTASVALLLSMGNLFYRDVKYLFEIVITLWMLATSVVYPVERIGGRLAQFLALNPMTPIIEAYRSILLRGQWPEPGPLAIAATTSVALLAVSWVAFHRAEAVFAERV
ncbi:MAG: ABC transporter permease [Candidatus Eisenbacteria bacterium]